MGIHSLSGTTKRRLLTEVRVISNKILIKMAETVETTTPTVEEVKTPEVATNGEAEAATPAETATEKSSANGASEAEPVEEASEASKRKADTPVDEETVEKIAKLKEVAAEVVSEAEKDLPSEPLTEAEATA